MFSAFLSASIDRLRKLNSITSQFFTESERRDVTMIQCFYYPNRCLLFCIPPLLYCVPHCEVPNRHGNLLIALPAPFW